MADTQRSYSELIALLPDNSAGAISPQDMRDVVKSTVQPYGSWYSTSSSGTVISGAGTYYKGVVTASAVNSSSDVSTDSGGRLTYNGVADRHFHIAVSVSMTSSSNNQIVGLQIANTGTTLAHSTVRRKISTGADVGSTAIHADTMLSTGDYIELWATNETSASNVQLVNVYFFAMGMLV